MFDHRHYVPILRWKRGEWVALREMLTEDRAALTPLIELCPKDFAAWSPQNPQVANDVLTRKADEIRKNCGHGTLFVDLVHLDLQMPSLCAADGTHALVFLTDRVRMREPSFLPDTEPEVIPVTGLDRSSSYQSAVRSVISVDERGVCIRLRGQQLNQPTLPVRLQELLDFLELEPGEADLIVDLQMTDGSGVSLPGICDGLPSLHQWRTFTVASGAFPKDLGGFQVGQHDGYCESIAGAGGVSPCGGRANAGSSTQMSSKKPAGQVLDLTGSRMTASPSLRIETVALVKRNSSGNLTACRPSIEITSVVFIVTVLVENSLRHYYARLLQL